MGFQMKLCFRKHISGLTSEFSILVKQPGEILWELFIHQNENLVSEVGTKTFLEALQFIHRLFQTVGTTYTTSLRCKILW